MDSSRLDRAALQLHTLRHTQPDARLWAVLPAVLTDTALADMHAALRAADGFALHQPAQASILRRLDWRGPLWLLPGVPDARALELCSRLGLWHSITQAQHIEWLAAHKSQQPQHICLPMQPHSPAAHIRSRFARLSALPQVDAITLYLPPGANAAQQAQFLQHTHDLAAAHSVCTAVEDGQTAPHLPLPCTVGHELWLMM